MDANASEAAPPVEKGPADNRRALIGLRLLALVYDAFPVLALWMIAGATYVFLFLAAGHDVRENIRPLSGWWWWQWGTCFFITGAYAVLSWYLGGQTLGMRPWRLRVITADGGIAKPRRLWVRFFVGLVSLLAGGLGFWWAWIDRDHLTWHDRASGTRMIRMPKGWEAP